MLSGVTNRRTLAGNVGLSDYWAHTLPFDRLGGKGIMTFLMRRFDSDPRLQFLSLATQEPAKMRVVEFHRNLHLI